MDFWFVSLYKGHIKEPGWNHSFSLLLCAVLLHQMWIVFEPTAKRVDLHYQVPPNKPTFKSEASSHRRQFGRSACNLVVSAEFCDFKICVIKWCLDFLSYNFGLTVVISNQTRAILKSRKWFHTKGYCPHFNYHYERVSMGLSDRRKTAKKISC